MPYIGNPIYQSAFVTDTFSGNGSTTAFTMSVAPAGTTNVLVAVSGVLQDPSTYGVVGTTITFSTAPPTGTGNISCRYLGVPVTGVTTTAYRTVTEFTATANQRTFTPPSYTVGFINVYRNGVLLGSADYTATNGTTVVLATGATSGDLVTVESFLVSSVLNAIPNSPASVSTLNIVDSAITPAKLSTGGPYWDTSSNLGVGTTSPLAKLDVSGGISSTGNIENISPTRAGVFLGADSAVTNNRGIDICGSGYLWLDFTTTGSDFKGRVAYDNSVNAMIFATNATERMRINASGQVTTPYQPCFRATKSSGTTNFTGNTTLIYDVALVNIGNCYNASTGVFTAPVAGSYAFSFSYYTDNGTSEMVDLLLNDTTIMGRTEVRFNPGDNSIIASGMIIYGLNANDNVRVKNTNTGVAQLIGGPYYMYFNGFLIG